jgi:hypothetical protein
LDRDTPGAPQVHPPRRAWVHEANHVRIGSLLAPAGHGADESTVEHFPGVINVIRSAAARVVVQPIMSRTANRLQNLLRIVEIIWESPKAELVTLAQAEVLTLRDGVKMTVSYIQTNYKS